MLHKILDHFWAFVYKIIDWIGAGFSYVLFQAGIPLEVHASSLSPEMASVLHGIVSMLVPVGSFYLIHVFKELLKDKESWATKANDKVVWFVSFKWLRK